MAEQEEQISVIKSKIATLVQSAGDETAAIGVMQESLSSSSFSDVEVKREILDLVIPVTGPGSQGVPMEVDDDEGNDRVDGRVYVLYNYHFIYYLIYCLGSAPLKE